MLSTVIEEANKKIEQESESVSLSSLTERIQLPDKVTPEVRDAVNQQLDLQKSTQASSWDEVWARCEQIFKLFEIKGAVLDKETGGITKIIPPKEVEVAEVMVGMVPMARVGESDTDQTPIMPYDFNTGLYKESTRKLNQITNAMWVDFKDAARKEVIARLYQLVPFKRPDRNGDEAVLGNGIFNITTKEFSPHTPDKVHLTKSDVNFNPDATAIPEVDGWHFEDFLKDTLQSDDQIYAFYQLVQLLLRQDKAKNTFTYFYSAQGRTGKGTLTEVLRALSGVSNSTSSSIAQLETRFGLESVYDKSFVFGNENDNIFAKSSENIKNLASGDFVTVERKGLTNLTIRATPMIVQSMNSLPTFKRLDGGVKNRMRIFHFKKSFIDEDREDIKTKLIFDQGLLEAIAYKALCGIEKCDKIMDFSESKSIKSSQVAQSSSTSSFIADVLPNIECDLPIGTLYSAFKTWCETAGEKVLPRRLFLSDLQAELFMKYDYVPKNKKPRVDSTLYMALSNLVPDLPEKFSAQGHMRLKNED